MKKNNFDLYLEEQLKDPGFAQKFIKSGKAWDVAIQLVSLRKKAGLSQKELAKRVGTSQQQISRLESPSYEGHSLSMLRRVAYVLGASVHVEIQAKKQQPPPIIAEAEAIYRVNLSTPRPEGRGLPLGLNSGRRLEVHPEPRSSTPPSKAGLGAAERVKSKDVRKRRGLLKFELDFLKKEKVDIVRNFHIVEALYKEAVNLGIIPLKNPLDGIEVDLKIAEVVNRV